MVLFIAGIILHLFLNWTPFINYLKNKERDFSIFTKEFFLAFGFALIFIFGTLYQIPPFKTFVDLEDSIKASWEQTPTKAPFIHAELLTLKEFTAKMNLDLDRAISLLKEKGYVGVSVEKQQMKQIADELGVTPADLLKILSQSSKVL